MKKFPSLLIAATVFVATVFIACRKDIDDPISRPDDPVDSTNNSIKGTWNFISMNAQTRGITEVNFGGESQKSVSALDYITSNNAGTMAINDSVMSIAGITYTLSGNVKKYKYKNGSLIDSVSTPFNFTLPLANSSSKYKLINADSIYFPEGGFISIARATTPISPSGGRINISNNALILSQSFHKITTGNVAGSSYHIIESGTAIITFQKQ